MKKRIKQLAEQARHWAHFDGLQQNPTSTPDILFEGKFAELIVQECAMLTLDYKNKSHYEGWIDYRDLIKEHFGVE